MKKTARSYNSTLRSATKKTADRNKVWREIRSWRIDYLIVKYAFPLCEYCGRSGYTVSDMGESLRYLDPHHIDGNRNNTSASNCYICHRICHSYITDNNIQVAQEDFKGVK